MKTGVPKQRGFHLQTMHVAFTLVEVMVAVSILSLVVLALIYSHLIGLRMFNVTATKLAASQGARAALDQVRDDIRSAKTVYVGTGDNTGFTNAAPGSAQIGNAVQIYPWASTNQFIRYYLDAAQQKLKRLTNGSAVVTIVASSITNRQAFQAEDFAGNVLTNNQNNRVILMSLEFYQWEFPVAQAAGGALYDYYRLQTRVTRRALE
jgi:type II secretory pathway pseudopilin PulG